jgi:hypothetical protein
MNFIERISGISPDGGNGIWEMAFGVGVALAVALAAAAAARVLRARRG